MNAKQLHNLGTLTPPQHTIEILQNPALAMTSATTVQMGYELRLVEDLRAGYG